MKINVFTRNATPCGIRNGQLGTVKSINPLTRTLGVRLDNGKTVLVPLNDYKHVKLGYAVTTHKSQGMTTQNTYILTDPSMQDKELSYVQVSRARGRTRIFTTASEAGPQQARLAEIMSKSHQKQLATDLLDGHRKARKPAGIPRESQRLEGPEQQISR